MQITYTLVSELPKFPLSVRGNFSRGIVLWRGVIWCVENSFISECAFWIFKWIIWLLNFREALESWQLYKEGRRMIGWSGLYLLTFFSILGWAGNAVGLERRQAPLHAGWWGHHQCLMLQPKPLLAVCCNWSQHQDMGMLKQPKCSKCCEKNRYDNPWLMFQSNKYKAESQKNPVGTLILTLIEDFSFWNT